MCDVFYNIELIDHVRGVAVSSGACMRRYVTRTGHRQMKHHVDNINVQVLFNYIITMAFSKFYK